MLKRNFERPFSTNFIRSCFRFLLYAVCSSRVSCLPFRFGASAHWQHKSINHFGARGNQLLIQNCCSSVGGWPVNVPGNYVSNFRPSSFSPDSYLMQALPVFPMKNFCIGVIDLPDTLFNNLDESIKFLLHRNNFIVKVEAKNIMSKGTST